MALTNYTTLQASISDWLADSTLTSVIPDFIQLAEAGFNKTLRTRSQITVSTISLTDGSASLPSDFLEAKTVIYRSNPDINLEYAVNGFDADMNPYGSSGMPSAFTIVGSTIKVMPKLTGDVELTYFAKIPALASNSTNWLLTNHPAAYLFGSLLEAGKYKRSQEVMTVAASYLKDELDKISASDMPSTRMAMRLSRQVP
jgi:hypothetical protein